MVVFLDKLKVTNNTFLNLSFKNIKQWKDKEDKC